VRKFESIEFLFRLIAIMRLLALFLTPVPVTGSRAACDEQNNYNYPSVFKIVASDAKRRIYPKDIRVTTWFVLFAVEEGGSF
jgi:hypothetical protein